MFFILRCYPLDVTLSLKCNTPQFCHGHEIFFCSLKKLITIRTEDSFPLDFH